MKPTLLVLVSKAQLEAAHPNAKVGDVLPYDRYDSTHATLEALRTGGRLVLVTVRPPDERLWRVAVLEAPRRVVGGWRAAPNTTAVVDVTKHRAKLRFSTGKGVSVKAGALGMSLQTPRTLTAEDVALLLSDVALPPDPPEAPEVPPPVEDEPVEEAPKRFDVAGFPWGRLRHAFGSAKDVPEMLAAIVSPDASVRGTGWDDLVSSVFHQGTLYSATTPVVRYLGELLETTPLDDEEQLGWLVDLLSHAAGGDFPDSPFGPLPSEVWATTKGFAPRDREGINPFTGQRMVIQACDPAEHREHTRSCHHAARGGMVGYARCLEGAPPKIRARVAFLLGLLVEDHALIVPGLDAAFRKEEDDEVAAWLVLGATGLARALLPFVTDALDDHRPLVACAAAYAVSTVGPHPPKLLRRIADAATRDDARAALLARLDDPARRTVLRAWV